MSLKGGLSLSDPRYIYCCYRNNFLILVCFLQIFKRFEMLQYIFVNIQEPLTGHVVLACSGNSGASGPAVHCGRLHLLNGTSLSESISRVLSP